MLRVGGSRSRLTSAVAGLLRPLKLEPRAVKFAVRLGMSKPVTSRGSAEEASSVVRVTEYLFRALFIMNSARRVSVALRSGSPLALAVATERKHYRSHLLAQRQRLVTARKVDKQAKRSGSTLGWYAMMDARTSTECRAANGRNFEIDRRPPIGYPGSVHPKCRCQSGPPHKTSKTVYQVPTRRETRRSA